MLRCHNARLRGQELGGFERAKESWTEILHKVANL